MSLSMSIDHSLRCCSAATPHRHAHPTQGRCRCCLLHFLHIRTIDTRDDDHDNENHDDKKHTIIGVEQRVDQDAQASQHAYRAPPAVAAQQDHARHAVGRGAARHRLALPGSSCCLGRLDLCSPDERRVVIVVVVADAAVLDTLGARRRAAATEAAPDRKSTRLNSSHT